MIYAILTRCANYSHLTVPSSIDVMDNTAIAKWASEHPVPIRVRWVIAKPPIERSCLVLAYPAHGAGKWSREPDMGT